MRKNAAERSKGMGGGNSGGASPEGARALGRALDLLEAVGRESGGLSDLARRCGLHPSTAYRMLETFRRRGFLDRDGVTGEYRIGGQIFRLGALYDVEGSLRAAALGPMGRLRDRLNENVNLGLLEGNEVVYAAQRESTRALRMFTQTGARAPLHCTGVGKALLFGRSDEEVRALLGAEPYARPTERSHGSLADFLKDLRQSERRGYAVDDEEREEGVRCVAAPIWGPGGKVVAGLSVSAPSSRLPKREVTTVGEALLEATRAVEAALSGETTDG